MSEAQRNECPLDRIVMRLMEDSGMCAYGEDSGEYRVPVAAMISRIGRIVEASMKIERERCARIAEGVERTEDRHWIPGSLYDTLRRETAAEIRREPVLPHNA